MILTRANHGFVNACRSRSENKRRASLMPSGSTTLKNAVRRHRRVPARPPSGPRRSRSHPHSVFRDEAHLPQQPRKGRLAHGNPHQLLKEAASLFEGDGGPPSYVGLEDLPGPLVELGFGAGTLLLRGEGLAFPASGRVAFDRRATYPEGPRAASLFGIPRSTAR